MIQFKYRVATDFQIDTILFRAPAMVPGCTLTFDLLTSLSRYWPLIPTIGARCCRRFVSTRVPLQRWCCSAAMFLSPSWSLFFKQPPLFGEGGRCGLGRWRVIGERWVALPAVVSPGWVRGGEERGGRGRLGWKRGQCDTTTWFFGRRTL